MTVVHVNYKYGLNDTGGAAIAATRAHLALLGAGVNSHYVTVWKNEEGPNVHVLPQGLRRRLYFALTKVLRCCWRFTPYRRTIALNVVPLFGLERVMLMLKPDVVHIHWINRDVMSFGQLAGLRRLFPHVRLVFNLHDLFLVNVLTPSPGRDLRSAEGVTPSNGTWLERWLFSRKGKAIHSVRQGGPAVFIGPSDWASACCRRSQIGRGMPTVTVPNLMGKEFECASPLWDGPDRGRFRILYGAYGGRRNPEKGFSDLVEALALLPDSLKRRTELAVFGEKAEACEQAGVRVVFLGRLASAEALVSAYRSADVFAFPSREETQGMTKIEAMFCGCPVVAFDRTACAEGVVPDVTGCVIRDGDLAGFAAGLARFAASDCRAAAFRERIAKTTRRVYGTERILSRLLAVYNA